MNHPSLALCLAALTAFSASVSCEKTPGAGSGVSFRAKAYSTSGTSTKTEYGGIEDSGQSYEYLHWVSGDRIRVYSPQAVKIYTADVHFADYKVDGIRTDTDNKTSVATLLSFDDGNGLGWGEENPHYFYSVYPSPAVNSNITLRAGTDNAVTVTGTIPATQTLSWPSGDYSGATVIAGTPDMNYAYMYAATSTAPQSQVELLFQPKFTAFQFEIGPGEHSSVSLSEFTLSTDRSAQTLSGTFTLSGVAGSEVTDCTAGSTTLTVPLKDGSNNNIVLRTGQTLVVTVFALPQTLTRLTISFTGNEIGTRSLRLTRDSEYLSFAACKKYRIYGLSFPRVSGIIASGEGIAWDGGVEVVSDGEVIAWAATNSVTTSGEGITNWITNPSVGSGGESLSGWETEN